jgi:hypothetical protein
VVEEAERLLAQRGSGIAQFHDGLPSRILTADNNQVSRHQESGTLSTRAVDGIEQGERLHMEVVRIQLVRLEGGRGEQWMVDRSYHSISAFTLELGTKKNTMLFSRM